MDVRDDPDMLRAFENYKSLAERGFDASSLTYDRFVEMNDLGRAEWQRFLMFKECFDRFQPRLDALTRRVEQLEKQLELQSREPKDQA